jgi:alanyl-tRNA synthetase
MPVIKSATKKTAKTAVKKPVKKITADETWAGFDRIEKILAETARALKETQKTNQETTQALKETQKANQETAQALKETQKIHQETEKTLNKTIDDIGIHYQETAQALKETQKANQETAQALKETQEAHKETEKSLNKAINGLSNTLGSLVEHIMTPDLPRKFEKFGFTFDKITTVKWAVDGSIYTQIDGLLENGDQAMVVEVKTTLRHDDIDDHVERMEKVRKYADDHGDKRKFLGAIAATITDKSTREYALKKGFFVIEPSGEDVKVTKPISEKIW